MTNPNAIVDQTCSNGHGSETCAAGWKHCKRSATCPDYILKTRRRGDPPPLPPREERHEDSL